MKKPDEPVQESLGWRARLGLGGLAFAWRLIIVLAFSSQHPMAGHPVIDEASYEGWARELAAGDWVGDEVFFQEPLYPYALALVHLVVGGDVDLARVVARVLQALLGALTTVLVAELGTRLFGRRAGMLGGAAFLLHRPAVAMCALLLKPNLFLPLITLAALLLARGAPLSRGCTRPGVHLLLGLVTGLGALLRGNMLLLTPWICLWPLVRTRGRVGALASLWVALGAALPLGTVAVRNLAVGDAFVLTTSGAGTNVYGGNNEDNPYGLAREFDWVRGIPEFEADDWRREAERREGRPLAQEEVSRYWLRQTARSLVAQPALHLRILWNKLRLTLGAYEVPDNHHLLWDARFVSPLSIPTGGFGLWGMLGLAGALLLLLERSPPAPVRRGEALQVLLLLLLYLGTIVLTVTSGRVRLALVPLLCPFAGYLVAATLRAWRAGPRWRPLVALALAGLVVHLPVLDRSTRRDDLAERDYNLAVQQLQTGELAPGEVLALQLLADYPDSQRVATLVSGFELARAREDKDAAPGAAGGNGQELLASAWARVAEPRGSVKERFRADSLAGAIALEEGRDVEALGRLERAREFDPEDPELTLLYLRAAARVHAVEGRYPAAAMAELRALAGGGTGSGEVPARASILLAEVDFALGAHGISTGELGEEELELARDRVRTALSRLRSVALDAELSERIRAAAHIAAARMQLSPVLGNAEAARGQLESALELQPGSAAAQVLLEQL